MTVDNYELCSKCHNKEYPIESMAYSVTDNALICEDHAAEERLEIEAQYN